MTRAQEELRGLSDLDVEAGLRAVEVLLRAECASEEPLLARMATEIVTAGGKRLRPRIGLLAYASLTSTMPGAEDRARGGFPLDVIRSAAAAELVHTATLVHDDIIDQSPLRRGRPTLHLTYGIPHAIVTADFLFTRGFGLTAHLSKDLIGVMVNSCSRLAEGEILEQRLLADELDFDTYLRIIAKKTAEPIAAGARAGALLAGAPKEVQEEYHNFGLEIGLAFQIQDDLLDVIGNSEETGKPVGLDAKVGVRTLPDLIANGSGSRSDADVIAAARSVAEAYVARAKDRLAATTPKGPHREALEALAEAMVARRA